MNRKNILVTAEHTDMHLASVLLVLHLGALHLREGAEEQPGQQLAHAADVEDRRPGPRPLLEDGAAGGDEHSWDVGDGLAEARQKARVRAADLNVCGTARTLFSVVSEARRKVELLSVQLV